MWPAPQGQLYGELGKLAAEGLIKVIDVGARGRKEYAVTEAGRAELRRWLTSPRDAPAFRSVQLLRVFLLGELTPVQGRQHLESLHSEAETGHARYVQIRDSHDWSGGDADFFARAALVHGLRRMRMEAEWASWVIDGLDQQALKTLHCEICWRLLRADDPPARLQLTESRDAQSDSPNFQAGSATMPQSGSGLSRQGNRSDAPHL